MRLQGEQKGASRTETCQVTHQPLTALIPVTKQTSHKEQISTVSDTVWALTISENPTFWYYIPYTLTVNTPIEFVLQDEQQNTLYKKTLTVSNRTPGILKIELPKTNISLKTDKMYHWYF